MKHVLYASKSVLMGDDVADLLLEYAGLLPGTNAADTVTVLGIGPDGNEVEVTYLLNAGSELVAESTSSNLDAPDNADAIAYLWARVDAIRHPKQAVAEDDGSEPLVEDWDQP